MFWVEAAFVVVFTINRLPTPILANKGPFAIVFFLIMPINVKNTNALIP